MEMVLTILEAIASIALIIIVLLQSGKEAGLSGAITGGSDTYLSKGKGKNMDQVLASATKWVALVWVALTLALSLI
ncbi:MAG: preprotein translocase subunit SecG [Oscillospiraceae bacterium]|nr:preprotein translocase subunit SecG [Oscillospiraceae bacterium]